MRPSANWMLDCNDSESIRSSWTYSLVFFSLTFACFVRPWNPMLGADWIVPRLSRKTIPCHYSLRNSNLSQRIIPLMKKSLPNTNHLLSIRVQFFFTLTSKLAMKLLRLLVLSPTSNCIIPSVSRLRCTLKLLLYRTCMLIAPASNITRIRGKIDRRSGRVVLYLK